MPDVDRVPEFARTAFHADTVAEAVRQPPLRVLRERAGWRRRHRISAWVVGVVAALVVAPLALAGTAGGPTTPEGFGPTMGEVVVLDPDTAVGVQHIDCAMRFRHTADGGRTWSPYGTTVAATTCPPNRSLETYVVFDERTYLVHMGGKPYVTRDAGATWQNADASIELVDAFPPAARPGGTAAFLGRGSEPPLAFDPDSGAIYRLRLAGEPPDPSVGSYVVGDGVIWAGMYSRQQVRSLIGWSTDRGASWQTEPLPKGYSVGDVAGRGRLEGYAMILAPVAGKAMPAHLLRTTDGGRTWSDIITNMPATDTFRPFTITADGTLLVLDGDRNIVWISRDRGATFTPGATFPTSGNLGVGQGFGWIGALDGGQYVTVDGEHWTHIAPPS